MSLHDTNVAGISAKNVEFELVVSESHMFEMDLDERDDVRLARLLKKGLFSKAGSTAVDAPVPSAHSVSSSSSQNIFVPIPSQPSTTNENLKQSGHSLPVRSSIRFSPPVGNQQSIPDPNHVGQSCDNVSENIVANVGENIDENVGEHVEPTNNSALDDIEPNENVHPTESEQNQKGRKHNRVVI